MSFRICLFTVKNLLEICYIKEDSKLSPLVHKTVHPASNHMNVVVDYSMLCLNVNIECPRTLQKETFSSENLIN